MTISNFISIETVKAARIEVVDGVGHSSGIYGEPLSVAYDESADAYIDEVRYPLDVIDLLLTRRDEVEAFKIKTGDKVLAAYDIGGEFLLVKGDFNEYAVFAIESNI